MGAPVPHRHSRRRLPLPLAAAVATPPRSVATRRALLWAAELCRTAAPPAQPRSHGPAPPARPSPRPVSPAQTPTQMGSDIPSGRDSTPTANHGRPPTGPRVPWPEGARGRCDNGQGAAHRAGPGAGGVSGARRRAGCTAQQAHSARRARTYAHTHPPATQAAIRGPQVHIPRSPSRRVIRNGGSREPQAPIAPRSGQADQIIRSAGTCPCPCSGVCPAPRRRNRRQWHETASSRARRECGEAAPTELAERAELTELRQPTRAAAGGRGGTGAGAAEPASGAQAPRPCPYRAMPAVGRWAAHVCKISCLSVPRILHRGHWGHRVCASPGRVLGPGVLSWQRPGLVFGAAGCG